MFHQKFIYLLSYHFDKNIWIERDWHVRLLYHVSETPECLSSTATKGKYVGFSWNFRTWKEKKRFSIHLMKLHEAWCEWYSLRMKNTKQFVLRLGNLSARFTEWIFCGSSDWIVNKSIGSLYLKAFIKRVAFQPFSNSSRNQTLSGEEKRERERIKRQKWSYSSRAKCFNAKEKWHEIESVLPRVRYKFHSHIANTESN